MGTNAEVVLRQPETVTVQGQHGMTQTDTMGGQLARTAEVGTSALEAQARALVQARFYVARQPENLRSWDQVEQRLTRECKRPGFARTAWYVLPIGNDAAKYPSGLSIRFAEAALRVSGNIDVQQTVVTDDLWKRTVRVQVIDLETNFGYTSEVVIDKTVERSNPQDREILSTRQNKAGKIAYLVAATEQEVLMKTNSAVSRAIRTSGLRLIPGDILDECKAWILDTRKKGAQAEDPELARKALLDSFLEIGVPALEIGKFVGHDTDHFVPAERELLRGIYTAIRDGQSTWKEIMESKAADAAAEAKENAGTQRVKDALANRGKTSEAPTKQTETPNPAPTASDKPTPSNPPASSQQSAPSAPKPPSTATNPPATAATNHPPAELADLAEFPDAAEPEWVKVKGVVYRLGETGYRKFEEPKAPVKSDDKPASKGKRGSLEFGE